MSNMNKIEILEKIALVRQKKEKIQIEYQEKLTMLDHDELLLAATGMLLTSMSKAEEAGKKARDAGLTITEYYLASQKDDNDEEFINPYAHLDAILNALPDEARKSKYYPIFEMVIDDSKKAIAKYDS